MTITTHFTVRTLEKDAWVWVAERDGVTIATITATGCHNSTVMFERVEAVQQQDGYDTAVALTVLLDACLDDCAARGYNGYFVLLNPARDIEHMLGAVLEKRRGAVVLPMPVMVAIGSTRGRLTDVQREAFRAATTGTGAAS